MGFLFYDKKIREAGKADARRTTKTIPINSANLSCRQCPLDAAPLKHPKMKPTGAAEPIFYSLGEAGGKTEDEKGEQFVGDSGELIRDRIPSKWEKFIRWNNTIRCRPTTPEGKNRNPAPLELACCRKLQEEDIAATKPKVILAFGGVALQWLMGGAEEPSILQWRGKRLPVKIRDHTCWVYPLLHPAAILHWRSMDNWELKQKAEAHLLAFEHDLKRVFADYERGLPEPYVAEPAEYKTGIEVQTAFGEIGLLWLETKLQEFAALPDMAIDIETNGLRPYSKGAKILSCSIGTFDKSFAFAIDHRESKWTEPERFRVFELLYNFLLHSGRKWAHALKFEQEWFNFFFDASVLYETQWGDTLAQAHVIDERRGKALDELTLQYFGFRLKEVSDLDRTQLDSYPFADVLMYNSLDAKWTDALRIEQTEVIGQSGVQAAYENLLRMTPSLVLMQAKGVVRNVPQIVLMSNDLEIQENRIKLQILSNKDVEKFRAVSPNFSPTSTTQLLRFFGEFLKVPNLRNVDEAALLKVSHPVAKWVIELRSVAKRRSTYITNLLDGGKYVFPDGLIHANFSHLAEVQSDKKDVGGTVTGRPSSSDPNMQNFPRRENKEVRRVVGAPPGHKLVSFDLGQIESRVVAMLSKDKTLIAETVRGDDIHGVWADKIGAKFVPKKLKEDRKWVRDTIKNLWTFPNFFGSVVEAIAADLSHRLEVMISGRVLRPFADEFWDKYPGVLKWQDELVALARKQGYVETATGFRRHIPMTRNELINMPVQGTAAHISLDAQVRLSYKAYKEDRPTLQPVLNVHDDLEFYLLTATLEQDIEDIAKEMCCSPYNFVTVPLAVEVSMGDNWADKETIATFTTKDF